MRVIRLKLLRMRKLLIGSALCLLACSTGGGNGNEGTSSGADGGGASNGGSNGGNGGTSGQSNGSGTGDTNGNGNGDGGPQGGPVPSVGGCPVFTADDAWNTPVDQAAVNADYTQRLANYLEEQGNPDLHPDFGADWEGGPFGIPITIVPEDQPLTPVSFDYDDESDPGPYPFPGPDDVEIEGRDPYSDSGDRHILVVQQGACKVWEAWACTYAGQWMCGSGAVFDLTKNSYGQRPKGYTSADAAGLSIMAGVIRYDEVKAGAINHAIRFTLGCTASGFTHPASHLAVPNGCDGSDPNAMPMGVRVRMKADYDTSALSGDALVVAEAMKKYGMILADNGSDFYFQGEPDERWSDENLGQLKDIPSSAFEVVDPVNPEM